MLRLRDSRHNHQDSKMESTLRLEKVLKLDCSADSTASSPEPVQRLWEQARACLLSGIVQSGDVEALRRLASLRHSLLISDLQAKILLPLLSAPLQTTAPTLLHGLRASALLLSCSWLRQLCISASRRKCSSSVGAQLRAAVHAVCRSLEDTDHSAGYVSEAVLLLGLVCVAPGCPPAVEVQARQLILGQVASLQGCPPRVEHLLGGMAYLMTASHGQELSYVCTALLSLWSGETHSLGLTLVDCLRLMHLFEFYRSSLDLMPFSVATSDAPLVLRHLVKAAGGALCSPACCAAVMAAAGFLRSLAGNNQAEWAPCILESQSIFSLFAQQLLPQVVPTSGPWLAILSSTDVQSDCTLPIPSCDALSVPFQPIDCLAPDAQLCLQCLVLAVAHCGPLPSNPHVLGCLLAVLVGDLLNLSYLHMALMTDASLYVAGSSYLRQLNEQGKHLHGCIMEDGKRNGRPVARRGSCTSCELEQLRAKTATLLFQHIRAAARALCQQYLFCASHVRSFTQITLWQHARLLYTARRFFYVSIHLVIPVVETGTQVAIQAVEDIFDAASFLDVVFFSLAIESAKGELARNTKTTSSPKESVAGLALDAISCMEPGRRLHMPQYGRLVTSSIHLVAHSAQACTALATYMPAYTEILVCPGPLDSSAASYHWDLDEIQSARIYFYLRILPLCLRRLPQHLFENKIASVMFLYMQHPSQELTEACHALFRAFVYEDDLSVVENGQISKCHNLKRLDLSAKEQLVAFYVKTSLETYPGNTSFNNFASGMGAIVQHLPPGNPAIMHCIEVLVDKYAMLQETVSKIESKFAGDKSAVVSHYQSHSEAELVTKAAEDIQHLLTHLIPVVDSLVLPELLKVVAKLILSLPPNGRFSVLREIFDVVSDMNDYTRKPVVVPWLQSLAFLASSENQHTQKLESDVKVLSLTSSTMKALRLALEFVESVVKIFCKQDVGLA